MAAESSYAFHKEDDGGMVLAFSGSLDHDAHGRFSLVLRKALAANKKAAVSLDLTEVTHLDDFGALLVDDAINTILKAGGTCPEIRASGEVRDVLDLFKLSEASKAPLAPKNRLPNPVIRLGGAVLDGLAQYRDIARYTGSIVFCLFYALAHPRSVRWGDVITSMRQVGVDAVPIVGLISFLLGFIIAFMSSAQLAPFGGNLFVASLVSLAMVRELSPIMTAIVVSGRSGSAFASEIGTMKINEEVNALAVMGFDPVLFLVIPKLLGSFVVVPILTLFSCLFGVFGGLVVGLLVLNLTYETYINQTIKYLEMNHIIWAVGKGAFFSVLISWIGCLRGFQVRGGAVAVGAAATSAVVSGIFLVIFWDSIFAFIQLYWD
ncbi:MAG: ABC transporter permease [Deltaproteobacteria bacterium]|nr:ABC transporter permease [Deltaproteobacteria bacterium]